MSTPEAAATLTMRELLQTQRTLVSQGVDLIRQWNDAFPRGTIGFRLARLAGESNTLLRWRRTTGVAAHGRRFELLDDLPRWTSLPAAVRARVLTFEDCRIRLNYQHALASYQLQRFRELQHRRDALAQLRRFDAMR